MPITKASGNSVTAAAKGDLVVGNATNDSGILSVGANGETLVADSSASTGLRWQGNFAAGKNKLINGDFSIWQRGTTFNNPAGNSYSADRWILVFDGSGATRTITQQTFTPGTAPVAGYEGQYFLRYNQSVAGSGAGFSTIGQRIEDVRTFAGQTVTLSFWAKSDATRTLPFINVVQRFGAGGSAETIPLSNTTTTLTTSWQRFTYTFNMPSVSGKTIGTNSYVLVEFYTMLNQVHTIDVWGFQLEAGSVATSFQTATGTLQGEFSACQRYYVRFGNNPMMSTNGYNRLTQFAPASTTTRFYPSIQPPVPMRVAPTSLEFSSGLQAWDGGSFYNLTSLAFDQNSNLNISLTADVASGLTVARPFAIIQNNTSAAFIALNAEL